MRFILYIFLFSVEIFSTAYADDYGLPTIPGEVKTSTSLASLNQGFSMFVDYRNPDEVQMNLGVDPMVAKNFAYSGALSGGETDAGAHAMQRTANSFPILYAYILLSERAKNAWQKLRPLELPSSIVRFRLIMRIANVDGSLQDHLVETFTCTAATIDFCDASQFEKLPDDLITPWFHEALDNEARNNRHNK